MFGLSSCSKPFFRKLYEFRFALKCGLSEVVLGSSSDSCASLSCVSQVTVQVIYSAFDEGLVAFRVTDVLVPHTHIRTGMDLLIANYYYWLLWWVCRCSCGDRCAAF
jgi:hypothetical protein